MAYEDRLKAAAKIIHATDERAGDAPVKPHELGVTATLKPHQVEGVSWLVRRYILGVNVVLGEYWNSIISSNCCFCLYVGFGWEISIRIFSKDCCIWFDVWETKEILSYLNWSSIGMFICRRRGTNTFCSHSLEHYFCGDFDYFIVQFQLI